MLDKIYTSKTNKQLQSALNLYSAVFIVSIVMPIILETISYLLIDKIQYSNIIIFSIVIIWSLSNIKFLKKKLNNKNGKEV
jgi:cytochrome c biogenesis protein CcdA